MAFPYKFGSPTPVIITDQSGSTGTSANIPVIDASVGAVNATAPVFADQIGWLDGTGKLQAVSAANPLPVSGSGGGGGGTASTFGAAVPSLGTAAGASDGVNMQPLLVDGSGFLKVNVAAGGASGGTSSTFGAAFPATGTAIGASDGTNMVALKVGQQLAAASVPVVLTAAQITTLTPLSSVAVTQGTAASLNATVVGTGTFAVQAAATLAAETTKVIGVVRNSDGAGNLLTSNSTTPAAHFALDGNITSILGTAPTTVGKLDVKGADGDVFVRQTAAANLNATVVGTGTFAVQAAATLAAETTKVIGVTRSADGSGNLLTSTANALDINIKSGSIANTTFAATQATGTNLHTVVDSGTITTVSAVTAITNALPAGTNLLGKISGSDETSTIYNGTTALTPLFASISASASGASTVIAAVGGKQIRVIAISLMSNGTVNVKFQSHVSPTDLTGLYYLIANTGFALAYCPVGLFQTISGEALDINLSGSIAVGGCLTYVTV